LALSLPEAAVADHFGVDSYRVRGKIFATVPDRHHVRVRLEEVDIRALVHESPDTFEAVWWGSRLSAVAVDLRRVTESELLGLLADAWARRAPKRVVAAWTGGADTSTPARARHKDAPAQGRRQT
jgi:hypothetical protein